jgi:prolyl oligopeptidase
LTPFDSPDFAPLAQGRPSDSLDFAWLAQGRPRYPPARVDPVVETLHGVRVPDPYRWLEDAASPETLAWVEAQNALTRSVLDGPARDALVRELTGRFDYPRTLTALGRGTRVFFSRNPGLLNQPILHVQEGPRGEPRVLIDPNSLSADGTTAVTAMAPSPDGSLLAYALSEHGSDRQIIRIRHVESARDLEDRLEWVKFASIAWTRAGSAFYYLRFPEPGSVPAQDEQYFGRIYFHRLGTAQQQDVLVFERPAQKEIVPLVHVTHDDRYVVIVAQRGASDDSEVYLIDRQDPDSVRPLFTGFDAAYDYIDSARELLFFRTTRDAPRGRIVSVDPEDLRVTEVVPESPHRLSTAVISRDGLCAVYLANASDRIERFTLDGGSLGRVELPGIGSIVTIDAQPESPWVLLTYASFTEPPSAWVFNGSSLTRLDPPSGRSSPAYVTRQVWYPSKDGTLVSMFLVHRADLQPDGERPVLLSGYGGFNINRTPAYDPGNFPFLDRGGIFALANLRGGGEYGEEWHRAGMLDKKQNVFDDFIAAAEFLIRERYTHAAKIAIEGGSNGGLLVGAAMIQRPDLFGAVLCRVPVADMLRYHLFTVGRFWIPEYGSADDPAQFEYLLSYSPYHNVRDGVRYPATLIMTADTDDRVSPGMAKKFAARLQAADSGGPILIRVETKAGHGAGKPVTKLIEEEADMLAFLQIAGVLPAQPNSAAANAFADR